MKGYIVMAQIAGSVPIPPGDLPTTLPSVWTAVDGDTGTLILAKFANRTAADEHEREWVSEMSDSPIEMPTPDIRGLSVEEERGQSLPNAPIGSYLSLVSYHAPIGRGAEIGEDISDTLASLRMLPGYEGHVRAHNVSLEEELWVLVMWSSLPPIPPLAEDISFSRYQRAR